MVFQNYSFGQYHKNIVIKPLIISYFRHNLSAINIIDLILWFLSFIVVNFSLTLDVNYLNHLSPQLWMYLNVLSGFIMMGFQTFPDGVSRFG